MRRKPLAVLGLTGVLVLILGAGGAVWAECQPKIEAMAPEAELVSFQCVKKDYNNFPSTWFEVTLKNKSDQDQRFKVNIFLPDGKAVGGLLPQSTSKGLVNPGAEIKGAYPAQGVAEPPAEISLMVKTLSKD